MEASAGVAGWTVERLLAPVEFSAAQRLQIMEWAPKAVPSIFEVSNAIEQAIIIARLPRNQIVFDFPEALKERYEEAVAGLQGSGKSALMLFDAACEHVHAGLSLLRHRPTREAARDCIFYVVADARDELSKKQRELRIRITEDAAMQAAHDSGRASRELEAQPLRHVVEDLSWLGALVGLGALPPKTTWQTVAEAIGYDRSAGALKACVNRLLTRAGVDRGGMWGPSEVLPLLHRLPSGDGM